MIKLIIVDDEKKTREGLKKCIQWKALGIDMIEEAEDGAIALDLASDWHPDIVLCDVRMPRMNGMEFVTQLRKNQPDCKIIFISGYSDKEYLKSAIQLKAVSYIEKPVNINELSLIIHNTVVSIKEEQNKKNEEIKKDEFIEKSTPIITQHISLYLTNSLLKPEDIQEKLKFANLNLPINSEYITATFKFAFNKAVTADIQQDYLNQILGLIEKILASESLKSISGIKENTYIISHIIVNCSISSSFIHTVLNRIHKSISGIPDASREIRLIIGVGKRVHGLENVYKSYQESVIAIHQSFYSDSEEIVFYEATGKLPYSFGTNLEKILSDCLAADDMEKAVAFINELYNDICSCKGTIIDYVKNTFYNLLVNISDSADDKGIIIFSDKDEKDALWQTVTGFNSFSKLKDYTLAKLKTFFENSNVKSSTSKTVYDIMKYIQNNYNDNMLSIKTISEHLFLTNTYICMLFKKETGKTINEYITEKRIEKSKELMKISEFTLSDISSRVGYANPKYFTALFKKIMGCTPSEYRERH